MYGIYLKNKPPIGGNGRKLCNTLSFLMSTELKRYVRKNVLHSLLQGDALRPKNASRFDYIPPAGGNGCVIWFVIISFFAIPVTVVLLRRSILQF